jgi:hypothetical protein
MSVRATERLIGDLVYTPALPNGPKMIVQSVDIEAKLITTVWFTDGQEIQEGVFPSSALDRVDTTEEVEEPVKKAEPVTKARRGASRK